MQGINLLEIFKDMPEYAIMKIRGDLFPEYKKGQDIDIVCRYSPDVCEYLLQIFSAGNVRFSCRGKGHIHFDIMDKKKIELRFDLYAEFISPKFTEDILQWKQNVKYGEYEVWITSIHQDILIKAWEYKTNKKRKYRDFAQYIHGLDAYTDR